MSERRRPARVGSVAVAVLSLLLGVSTAPVTAAAPEGYVKYYTVKDGSETLKAVAQRFLGAADRSSEIFNLNAGRKQPDGGTLTDGDGLRAGWHLVLPWDAVGTGVEYGLLPTEKPPAATPPASPKSAPEGAGGPPPPPPPSAAAPPPASGSASAPADPSRCAAATSALNADWTREKLRHEQVWLRSKGANQIVAIIDSGVDGTLPELDGHVAAGADLVGGGRGDVDCAGTGTAMAGIVVAQPQGGAPGGLAPAATVLPVRLVAAGTDRAKPADQARAIEIAVSAGVRVIALGGYVDPADPEVAKAIEAAVGHDVVVVAGAGSSSARAGVLRVGGVDAEGRPAADYPPGGVDVVAPGADVSSLSGGTDGTRLAVAFAAAQAALVRAVYPDLEAKEVGERIQRTASEIAGANRPDPATGWGLIDPVASVTSPFPGATAEREQPKESGSGAAVVVLLFLVGAAFIVAGYLIWRFLRSRPVIDDDDDDEDDDEHSPSSFGKLGPALIGAGAFWGDGPRRSDDDEH